MTRSIGRVWQVGLLVALMVLAASVLVSAEQPEPSFEELLEDAVELVLRHHPSLVSQKTIVASGQTTDFSRRGLPLSLSLTTDVGTRIVDSEVRLVPLVGMSISLPLIDPDRSRDEAREDQAILRELERDIQSLQTMQEQILSRFMDSIYEIVAVNNRLEAQRTLLGQLQVRRTQLDDFVRGGLATVDDIWNLDERIANTAMEASNVQAQKQLKLTSAAYNFGGDQWPLLKSMLEQLIQSSEVLNSHG